MKLKEGIVYRTRNGKRVKMLITNLPAINDHTCVGVIFDVNAKSWMTLTWKPNGSAATFTSLPDPFDIVGYWAPVKAVR